ncbi:hypothetical protein BC834DRAFT_133333 [Gloeopeniophorella convolvens]|nr:hypothetical protein BC834DRAFT_133333 [Gloeopeniophorella convolvens]
MGECMEELQVGSNALAASLLLETLPTPGDLDLAVAPFTGTHRPCTSYHYSTFLPDSPSLDAYLCYNRPQSGSALFTCTHRPLSSLRSSSRRPPHSLSLSVSTAPSTSLARLVYLVLARPQKRASSRLYSDMALAHYPPLLSDRRPPVHNRNPYISSLGSKQASPMSNPSYSWQKSSPTVDSWDQPQTSWTVDSSYSTLQSAVQPNEPGSSSSHAASRSHSLHLSYPEPYPPRGAPLATRSSAAALGSLSHASPGLRTLGPPFGLSPPAGDLLYTIDEGLDADHLAPSTVKAVPVVKEEQQDDASASAAFVFESSPSTPGPSSEGPRDAQVPLRATQATKAMRKMMSVFRLNPFAVQGSAPTIEEAGPLEEEGRLIEFQLPLEDSPPPSSPSARSTSVVRDSRHTSPEIEWTERAHSPPDTGNRSSMERTGAANISGWGYSLPTEFSPPYNLTPAALVERRGTGTEANVSRPAVAQRIAQTPDQHLRSYSRSAQSSPGDGSAHSRGYGHGSVTGQNIRRYSGGSRDSTRTPSSGASYASVFEQDHMSTSTVMSGGSYGDTPHAPRRSRGWSGSGQPGSYS